MADIANNRWSHPGLIVVATDLSDLNRLMPFAIQQANETGARLLALHVMEPVMSIDEIGSEYYASDEALGSADKTLQPWCEYARRENVVCEALVREGFPAQQIVAVAREFRADRVLMGTRGHSKLRRLLIGSVAEQVLRSVNLPVMTVGPEAHLLEDGSNERIVLHATTLRETSRPSAALACQVAAAQKAKLILLHVLPPTSSKEREKMRADSKAMEPLREQAAQEQMRQLAAETGTAAGGCVEPVVVHGNPAIEILAMAQERNASLIVLGSVDYSKIGNVTRNRVVYRVLAHAWCPVLTLRETQHRAEETQAEAMEAAHQ